MVFFFTRTIIFFRNLYTAYNETHRKENPMDELTALETQIRSKKEALEAEYVEILANQLAWGKLRPNDEYRLQDLRQELHVLDNQIFSLERERRKTSTPSLWTRLFRRH